jgi:hypothetical protein
MFPTFTVWQFALAGAIAAAGPVIIHLLNRRRYRTVQWAAMDFLREAMQRNRRILQIRDLVLMAMRCLAVLLFGLALARPFFSSTESELDDRQPLHAIVVIDNSLSMNYETLGGTLLERAKAKAMKYVDKLPSGSRISVIPACGSAAGYSLDPYANKEAAAEAIERIAVVDRTADINRVINESKTAAQALPDMAKRYVFLGDQQQGTWRGLNTPEQFKELPPMQIVNVAPDDYENTWISDVRIQDEIADVETPTKFVVDLRHTGDNPRHDVQVSLWVDNAEVATKTVTLDPGDGTREVDFDFLFSSYQPESERPLFVPVRATIAPDKLAADDERFLAAPVVAALPMVFIDQYGAEDEDPARNRLGETRHLRKLLSPVTSRGEQQRQLIKIRHLSIDQLQQDALSDARVVAIAGVARLEPAQVQVLREYVQQGGQLLIGAGADFDPASWSEAAWLQGDGILPLPLKREPLGEVPQPGVEPKIFNISFESLGSHPFFKLAGVPENDLRDIYAEPYFFKAVDVDAGEEAIKTLRASLTIKLTEQLQELAEIDARETEFVRKEAGGDLSETERQERLTDVMRRRELRPEWLTWTAAAEFKSEAELPPEKTARERHLEQLVDLALPKVIARFTTERGPPFLVERNIGRGRVVFCSSGLLSAWNTLPKTNAIVMFDRILRDMIKATLPPRDFAAVDQLTLPLPREDQQVIASLQRPGGVEPEPIDVGFIGKDERGVTLHGLLQRGLYTVSARAAAQSSDPALAEQANVWEVPLAINGDPEESNLAPLTAGRFADLAADSQLSWVEEGDEIPLAGATISGQNLWWYLAAAVLLLLLAEMAVLAWPKLTEMAAAPNQQSGTPSSQSAISNQQSAIAHA